MTLSRLILSIPLMLLMNPSLIYGQCDPSANIDVDWERNYDFEGGNDIAYLIIEIDDGDEGSVPDNGYIVVGSTETEENLKQAWIVRLNPDGTATGGSSWEIDEGGSMNDWAQAVEQVTDDKIVVVGTKRSSTFGAGNNDNVWLLEIDLSNGTVLSEHEYGSIGHDKGYDVKVDLTTGYYVIAAMAGQYKTTSPSDDLYDESLNAKGVYWVLEVDPASSYQIQWDETFIGIYTGGTNDAAVDIARSIVIDENGNYVVTGSCKSCDPDEWHDEFMTVKIDPSSSYAYTKTVDGYTGKDQVGWNIIETDDGGYLTCGITHPSGYPPCLNNHNFHVIRHDNDVDDTWSPGCQLNDGVEFGGNAADNAYCSVQACDGGYIIVGSTKSSDEQVSCNSDGTETYLDGRVLKINSSGAIEWDESFGNYNENDAIYTIKQLHDGSYIMAGEFGAGTDDQDFYVIKFQLEDCAEPTGLSRTTNGCHAYLSWDMADCVYEYELIYKKTGEANWHSVLPVTSPYTLDGYSGGTNNNYSWGVRAWCSPGEASSFATGNPFSISTCRLANNAEENGEGFNTLAIYPNPSDGLFKVILQLDDASGTTAFIELFEPTGRIKYSSALEITEGIMEVELDGRGLAHGFYYLSLSFPENSYHGMVLIQ